MKTAKILEVVARYRQQFEEMGIPKKRMDPTKYLGDLEPRERLAHAHYLLDGIVHLAQNPEKRGRTGRHLGSVQTILCYENFYTLNELTRHNRPD